MTAPAQLESWIFPPRRAVDPPAAANEWAWVRQHVAERRRDGRMTGPVWARKEVVLEGDQATVTFTIFPGQTNSPDSNSRNL